MAGGWTESGKWIVAGVMAVQENELWKWRDMLRFAGGIALFLYGMYRMGEGISALAGGRMKIFLERMAKTPLRAVAAGAGVTALLQSSSAVTVMVVQFTDAGMMGLRQAAGIIMGANVGTCVTAWLLGAPKLGRYFVGAALAGAVILQGMGGRIHRARRPDRVIAADAKIKGAAAAEKATSTERAASTGSAAARAGAATLFGFALLFLGMEGMQAGTASWADSPAFRQLLIRFSDPMEGVLAGALVTAVLQSSSVSVGILQALSAGGGIRYATAIPVILGQNIGTCVTSLLSCIATGVKGRMAAVLHLLFNVVGAGIILFGFCGLQRVLKFPFLSRPADGLGIAVIHTVFNLGTAAVLLPLLYIRDVKSGESKPEQKKTTGFWEDSRNRSFQVFYK